MCVLYFSNFYHTWTMCVVYCVLWRVYASQDKKIVFCSVYCDCDCRDCWCRFLFFIRDSLSINSNNYSGISISDDITSTTSLQSDRLVKIVMYLLFVATVRWFTTTTVRTTINHNYYFLIHQCWWWGSAHRAGIS